MGVPGGSVVKNLPANAGDIGSTLVWEDPTCRRATKPVHHNYWACTLKQRNHNYWAHAPHLLKPAYPTAHALQQERPLQWEAPAAAAAAAKSLQSCPSLCNPIGGSPPGSPVPGILQARTLEWVAISFSNAWKWKVKVKSVVSDSQWSHGLQPTRLLHPWNFPGKSTGVGCHRLLWRSPYITTKVAPAHHN